MAKSSQKNQTDRKGLHALFASLYENAPCERSELGWPLCVYCGEPADCIDHVPPLSRVYDFRTLQVPEKYYRVKCGTSCNNTLGSTLQHDLLERIDVLKGFLRKKLGKRDVGYLWVEDDLDGLGPNLRSHVGSSMRKTESLVRRIDYRGGLRAVLGMLKDTHHG